MCYLTKVDVVNTSRVMYLETHTMETQLVNIYHHLVSHGLPVIVGYGGSSDSCWQADPVWLKHGFPWTWHHMWDTWWHHY